VYWFHPLVWVAARQLRRTSEQAADDAVLGSNIAPSDYARHLVGIAGQLRGLDLFGQVALPMASSSALEGRVLAILDPQRNHRNIRPKTCCVLIAFAVLLLIPCAILRLGYAENERSIGPAASVTSSAGNDASQSSDESSAGANEPDTPSQSQANALREPPPALLTASGKVVDPAGRPIAGATVYLREWSTYRISTDPYNENPQDVLATTHTDAGGAFRFEKVAAKSFSADEWLRQNPWDLVIAGKSYGLAWRHLRAPQPAQAFEIKLQPAAAISGRVTDQAARPIKGAEVRVCGVDPLGQELRFDFADPGTLDLQASQLRPSAKTDDDGRFQLDGLPRDVLLTVMVTHDNFGGEFLHVATTNEPQPDLDITPRVNAKMAKIHPANFSVVLGPAPPRIAGQVLAADTNRPIAGARIEGMSEERWSYATANDQGQFLLKHVLGSTCRVRAMGPHSSDYLGRIVLVDMAKEKGEVPVKIKLVRGEPLRGMVMAVDTGQGIPGVLVGFDTGLDWNQLPNGALLPSHSTTDSAGRFHLVVPPGKGKVTISGPAPGFDLPRPTGRREDLAPEFAKEVEVVRGQATPEVKFALRREGSPIPDSGRTASGVVTGRVVDSTGQPVAGAEVAPSFWFQVPGEGHPVATDRDGRFWLRLTRRLPEEFIIAIDKQRRLRGHVPLPQRSSAEPQKTPLEIRLAPTGTIAGRVLEGDKPVVDAQIQASELESAQNSPTGSLKSADRYFAKTDENGRFEIPLVEAERQLHLTVYIEGYAETEGRDSKVQAVAGQVVEVKRFSMIRTDKVVSGTVIDPDGNPVAGVSVSAAMRSGMPISRAFTQRPTGKDGRFTIRGVANVPLTLMAYIRPSDDATDRTIRFSARVDAEPGEADVRIVLDPKLAGRRRADPAPAAVPTPARILEKLRARRDSVENLLVEASWEDYENEKPSSWEDGAIYRDKQGRIRVRYHHGPGALASADKKNAKMIDETYTGKFTVNAREDPTLDRLGKPRKPGELPEPTDRYRSVMIYNGKWPRDRVAAESHRNPFYCMDGVIGDLSRLLAAAKTVSIEPVKGQPGVYELGYELDPQDDPHHLKHRVLVDAGKGWVVTRHEQFFPDGKSARLSTCDYRRGEDGWWVPSAGQFRNLWGRQVPDLDWRFKVGRVVVNDPRFDQSVFQPELEAFPLRELTESVAGIVVDPDGNPVEGVSVRADLHSSHSLLMAFAWEPTGKDGRFAIDWLPKAPIPITAYIEPSSDAKDRRIRFPASVTAQPGQKDVRIVLDPKLSRGRG
jgi:protocatechuate 3,4-dioxygenase beta subunit